MWFSAVERAITPLKRKRNLTVKFESACTSNDKTSMISQNPIKKIKQEKVMVELAGMSMNQECQICLRKIR